MSYPIFSEWINTEFLPWVSKGEITETSTFELLISMSSSLLQMSSSLYRFVKISFLSQLSRIVTPILPFKIALYSFEQLLFLTSYFSRCFLGDYFDFRFFRAGSLWHFYFSICPISFAAQIILAFWTLFLSSIGVLMVLSKLLNAVLRSLDVLFEYPSHMIC